MQLGPLVRLAGLGTIDDKGVNGWQAAFEGTSGLQVELSRPHFAMADSLGNVYVADKDAQAIRKLDPDGVITTVAGLNTAGDDGDEPGPGVDRHLSSPNGLFVHTDGSVFILDLGNQKVRALSATGQLTTVLHAPGEMAVGRGLWVSADATLVYYSAGTRLMRWTADDGLSVWADGFLALGNLAMDTRGHLWATDRGQGQVWAIDPDGDKRLVVGQGDAPAEDGSLAIDVRLPGVRAVWPDGDGGMWLGTHESSRVWWLDGNGQLHLQYGPEDVSEVRGLSVDGRGCLLVVHHDAGFIDRACPR